ncbi:hypothetical protein ACLGFC_20385 [Klebsiella michiganensis]
MMATVPECIFAFWYGDAIFFAPMTGSVAMTSFDKLSAPALANTTPISNRVDIRISARQKQSKFSVCT